MSTVIQAAIDPTLTAFLRTLSGANKSQATITAYWIDLSQFTDAC